MRFQEAIASLGRPKSVQEAIAAIRAEHGDQAGDAAAARVAAADAAIPTTGPAALEAIRAEHGRNSTRWLADQMGISLRQAQRYMAGQGLSGRTAANRARRDAVIELGAAPVRAQAQRVRADVSRQASRRWIAAALIRKATRVSVGRVKVWDKSANRPAGSRHVGSHRVDNRRMRAQLNQAASLLESGDEEGAMHAFSDALLDAYSTSKGDPPGMVSGPLYIYDYPTGIDLETE